jgi:hypothetical protein
MDRQVSHVDAVDLMGRYRSAHRFGSCFKMI